MFNVFMMLLKFLTRLWPLWLIVWARDFGAIVWAWLTDYGASVSPTLYDEGAYAAVALGPVVILLAALFAFAASIRSKMDVRIAAAGLMLSGLVYPVLEVRGQMQTYPGYSFWVYVDRVPMGMWAGIILACLCAAVGMMIADKRPNDFAKAIKRSKSNLHGEADWMPLEEAKRRFSTGGIIIGEAYSMLGTRHEKIQFDHANPATWGPHGGKAPLLRFDGSGGAHVLVFAGSGGYKSVGIGVPTALEWPSGLVYLDPKGEVHKKVCKARVAMGRNVVSLRPSAGKESDGFNALDWIDPTKERSIQDIQTVVSWLAGEPKGGENAVFEKQARKVLECILGDIIFDPDLKPEEKTLKRMHEIATMAKDDLRAVLEGILYKGRDYGFGAPAAGVGAVLDIFESEKTWGGVRMDLDAIVDWLKVPGLARVVCGQSMRCSDIADGQTDVFINFTPAELQNNPGAARCIVGALMNAVEVRDGDVTGRVLFLLDEAYQFGKMPQLERARDLGRSYGINLMLIYQSVGQLEKSWERSGVSAWFETEMQIFSCINDEATARRVSDMAGEFTAIADSLSDSSGGSRRAGEFFGTANSNQGVNSSETARRLIKPDEIRRMRRDEQIVFVRGSKPLRCGRAIYFRRPDMLQRVGERAEPTATPVVEWLDRKFPWLFRVAPWLLEKQP